MRSFPALSQLLHPKAFHIHGLNRANIWFWSGCRHTMIPSSDSSPSHHDVRTKIPSPYPLARALGFPLVAPGFASPYPEQIDFALLPTRCPSPRLHWKGPTPSTLRLPRKNRPGGKGLADLRGFPERFRNPSQWASARPHARRNGGVPRRPPPASTQFPGNRSRSRRRCCFRRFLGPGRPGDSPGGFPARRESLRSSGELSVRGLLVGETDRPLELYCLADVEQVHYLQLQPTPLGTPFDLPISPEFFSARTLRLELVDVSTIWYAELMPMPDFSTGPVPPAPENRSET